MELHMALSYIFAFLVAFGGHSGADAHQAACPLTERTWAEQVSDGDDQPDFGLSVLQVRASRDKELSAEGLLSGETIVIYSPPGLIPLGSFEYTNRKNDQDKSIITWAENERIALAAEKEADALDPQREEAFVKKKAASKALELVKAENKKLLTKLGVSEAKRAARRAEAQAEFKAAKDVLDPLEAAYNALFFAVGDRHAYEKKKIKRVVADLPAADYALVNIKEGGACEVPVVDSDVCQQVMKMLLEASMDFDKCAEDGDRVCYVFGDVGQDAICSLVWNEYEAANRLRIYMVPPPREVCAASNSLCWQLCQTTRGRRVGME